MSLKQAKASILFYLEVIILPPPGGLLHEGSSYGAVVVRSSMAHALVMSSFTGSKRWQHLVDFVHEGSGRTIVLMCWNSDLKASVSRQRHIVSLDKEMLLHNVPLHLGVYIKYLLATELVDKPEKRRDVLR